MKIIKKFLIAVICLGLLVGFAFGMMMIGNVTGGGSSMKEPSDSAVEESGTELEANVIMIGDEKYTIDEGMTWAQFIEEHDDVVSSMFAGMLFNATGSKVLVNGEDYPRAEDTVKGATMYEFESIQYCEATLDLLSTSDIVGYFAVGMTWEDLASEGVYNWLEDRSTGESLAIIFWDSYCSIEPPDNCSYNVISEVASTVALYCSEGGDDVVLSTDRILATNYYMAETEGVSSPGAPEGPSAGDLVPQEPIPEGPSAEEPLPEEPSNGEYWPQEPIPEGPSDLPWPEEPSASI